jgi:hypothetical protein
MKFFSDSMVAALSSLCAKLDSRSIKTFVTRNAYSAFQLARIYKIKAIHFEDSFYEDAFGYAKKSGIQVSFNSSLVNEKNAQMFAAFAKSNYDPTQRHENALLVHVNHSNAHEVVDISSYKHGDKLVFYSNIKQNHVELKNVEIVGFSANSSIFSGSKRIIKQLRIANTAHKKKAPLPTYSNEDLSKLMSNGVAINFAHMKFLLSMIGDIVKMPMFASMLGEAKDAMSLLNKFPIFIDSMTKKEVMSPKLFLHGESRMKRIAKGSGVDEKVVMQLISFVLMISQHGIQGSAEELRRKSSGDPRLAKMMGQLGPLLKMFNK